MRDERYGLKFNHLTIQEFSHKDSHNNKWYHVLCDCGNDKKVMPFYKIKRGTNTTCGCRIGRIYGQKKNLEGRKYGMLLVLVDTAEKYVLCQCDCGRILGVERDRLLRTKDPKHSCGKCYRKRPVAKYENLIGKKFNRLTVKSYVYQLKRQHYWNCECECGNTHIVSSKDLKSGHVKSCSCLVKENGNKLGKKGPKLDLIGKKFGKLTVLAYTSESHWHCKCECGNEIEVETYYLTHDKVTSCKTCKERWGNYNNLIGMTFGYLTPIYPLHKNKKIYWHCECKCGNEKDILATSLVSGRTKSCGCYKKVNNAPNFVDLTGNRYGELTVLEFNKSSHNWKCQCDCGNIIYVRTSDLKRQDGKSILSCGHNNLGHIGSRFEQELVNYLSSYYIEKHNRTVLDGKEIDIYIPELKIGIEYNGSKFHASSGAIFDNKPKYYHRDKFLLAKEKGINLISIFDIDYENNFSKLFFDLANILKNGYYKFVPHNEIEYTNNDLGIGNWIEEYGYEEIGQEEPTSYFYRDTYLVYRCGRTIWGYKWENL